MKVVLNQRANTEARDFVVFMQICVAILVVVAHVLVCCAWGSGAGGNDWHGWKHFHQGHARPALRDL